MTTTPTNVQPLTVSSSNCRAAIGRTWRWVLSFAQQHGVPVWRVNDRVALIPARELVAALAAADKSSGPSYEAELAAMRESFARELLDGERTKQ